MTDDEYAIDDERATDPSPTGSEIALRSEHDWTVDSASEAVVAAVAIAADRDPLTLVPLYDRVDPEALDGLFSRPHGGRRVGGLCVTLRYEGFDVTVDSGGTVTVREGHERRELPTNVQHDPGRTPRMGDREEDRSDDAVDAAMDDFDDESADVKTYECDACGHRMEAEHQPGECPVCGGEMVDVSVSRE